MKSPMTSRPRLPLIVEAADIGSPGANSFFPLKNGDFTGQQLKHARFLWIGLVWMGEIGTSKEQGTQGIHGFSLGTMVFTLWFKLLSLYHFEQLSNCGLIPIMTMAVQLCQEVEECPDTQEPPASSLACHWGETCLPTQCFSLCNHPHVC